MLGNCNVPLSEDDCNDVVPEWNMFAMFNVNETPKKLKRNGTDFYTYFAPPLPDLVVVFLTGNWGSSISGKFKVMLLLENELSTEKNIGILSKNSKAICCEIKWTPSQQKTGRLIQHEGRLLKLVAVYEGDESVNGMVCRQLKEESSLLHTDSSSNQWNTSGEDGISQNENHDVFEHIDCPNGDLDGEYTTTPHPKKRKESSDSSSSKKRKRQTALTQSSLTMTPSTNPSRKGKDSHGKSLYSPTSSAAQPKEGPSGRWGHTLTSIDDGLALLVGGQGQKGQMSKDSVWLLNTGSLKEVWYKDIHCLNTETWQWSHPEVTGKAPTRAYHSATLFHDELLIFGGVYPKPHPQPDGCSEELIIFDTEHNSWYQPIVTGNRPTPRSGHSANLVDNQLYVFGGWDAPTCNNEMFILDLGFMEFRKPLTTGIAPSPRTWHSTIVTTDSSKLILYGGYNGSNALSDLFTFDVASLCWSVIGSTSLVSTGRAGHTITYVGSIEEADTKDRYVVFGGGDNESNFYSDVFELCL